MTVLPLTATVDEGSRLLRAISVAQMLSAHLEAFFVRPDPDEVFVYSGMDPCDFDETTRDIRERIDKQGRASADEGISAVSEVFGTGTVARVPVGEELLGRVVSPIEEGPPITAERFEPVERPAPGIVDRALVTQPLLTGLTVIDAMIPLSRGQPSCSSATARRARRRSPSAPSSTSTIRT